MALPKLALVASLALLASLPSAQADGPAEAQAVSCVYLITSSDSPFYVLEVTEDGHETFVGVPDGSGSYTGLGVGYTGSCWAPQDVVRPSS